MEIVTASLSEEHQTVLRKLAAFEAALNPFNEEGVRETLRFFDERLVLHRRKEEEVLFPALGRHIGTESGPIACMLEEHRDEKEKIESIRAALDQGTAEARERVVQAGRYILELLRNHIVKEDQILFPMAENTLGSSEKAEVKKGFDAIGYCTEAASTP